ncbi:MAG: hypothetical protein NTW54_04570 [Bacteroidetes bacterium]|nr:hypothetical protein [Bacteroidota bacterium]
MQFPTWFRKSKGGYFFSPIHWAGWLCYIISFADVAAAFYKLSNGTMNSSEQLKAVFPVVILNFAVLTVVIFLTSEKPKEKN